MPTSIPVFCHHNVSEADGHTPRQFEEHLAAIRDAGFRTISTRELVAAMSGAVPMPKKACVLTFDDCHLSNWTVAAPLLAKYSMTATFFCVTDFIGQGDKRPQLPPEAGGPELFTAPESFRRVLDADDRTQFLNEAELRALIADYGFEVHGHSARHQGAFRDLRLIARLGDAHAHWSATGIYPKRLRRAPGARDLPLFSTGSAYAYNGYWPHLRPADDGLYFRRRSDAERRTFCLEDFGRCVARMREVNGGGPQYLCWPWGQYDELSLACAREAGFEAAFSLERSANAAGGDVMRIHRIGVGKTKDGAWMASRLRMYSGSVSARFFFKLLRKRPEVKSVLYMTDSEKLSGGSRQMLNNIVGMHESGLRVTAVIPPGSGFRAALGPLTSGANPVEIVEFDGFRNYVRAASFVARLARRVKADVVHTFHARAYKSAALAKLPLFGGARYRLFINRGVIFPPNAIFALYCLAAQGVTVNSQVCGEVLRKYLVPQKLLRLVYNSFLPEPDMNGGRLPPERAPREKRGCRVLYLGNEGPAKGFDVFLRMAAELARRGVRDLEFVGAGVRDMRAFEPLVTPPLASRLRLPGNLSHAEALAELLAADVLVLPSRQESLPNVLLEAFACSLPVVCTTVGGMPELVHDGVNGLLRPSEDVDGLADAVAQLAADPLLRQRMGRINRRLLARRLGNAAKTLTLLRVYSGEALYEPLDIKALADELAREEASGQPEESRP
ncbi:Glycosyltransferase involved in cell wall bisynthesis [Humidesulfovibrio mexicanus]|uniref:Glycosyltransferase involved in cell wall bisynthesis n=1 Tax=Humidesulfovibrio mexicanus TaxID=147047 RepID=A0A239BZ32_9BACT|nr:glycosyltransferase [Humidesulfovibrio mexicanus]SNS12403.1 Glycosyltransferase involved in cell wall bisynthesis [Humidesulfovibrio mexicanus]